MNFGIIGLGRMGLSIAKRAIHSGIEVFGFDSNEKAKKEALKLGIKIVENLKDLPSKTRILWLMVPAGDTIDKIIDELNPYLKPEDIIIDGGNSNFKDSKRRAESLNDVKIHFIDCGTSGGLFGEEIGYSLMVGGDEKIYNKLIPLFTVIAAKEGFAHVGPAGAGHYVKMIHNGIEYALLQSYAEGFQILKKNNNYPNLDLEKVSNVWMHGSVIRSWILELCHQIFSEDQNFSNINGAIGENKTGLWTSEEAHSQDIPSDMIDKALEIRAWSRQTEGDYSTKLVALLRHKFGGHPVEKKEK